VNTAWLLRIGVALALALGAAWLFKHTEWVEVQEPLPLSDTLRADGTHVAQRLVQRLGGSARRVDHMATLPPPGATLVVTTPFWSLAFDDATRLQRWVEGGGHLVVDQVLLDDSTASPWLPPKLLPRPPPDTTPRARADWCRVLAQAEGLPPAFGHDTGFVACAVPYRTLRPAASPSWQLVSTELGIEAQRVALGRGRVTAFSGFMGFEGQQARAFPGDEGGFTLGAQPARLLNFSNRGLLEGDNAALLAALLDARPGAEVWFVTRTDRPALPLWLWQQAAPALLLAVAAMALLLWRRGSRLGPLQAAAPPRRRSLAAQVQGLADFLHRHQPAVLHAAALRALHETAARRVPGWARLTPAARTLALARATGLPEPELQRAQQAQVPRDAAAWSRTLALLETARRSLLEHRPETSPHRTRP
jgi:Domain of unknown function (DUF4350)